MLYALLVPSVTSISYFTSFRLFSFLHDGFSGRVHAFRTVYLFSPPFLLAIEMRRDETLSVMEFFNDFGGGIVRVYFCCCDVDVDVFGYAEMTRHDRAGH